MSLKISRILHAGYVFECENTKIAFDTIFENPFSRNCHAFPDVEFDHEEIKKLKFDAVFISHFHDDHCSFESLNLLNRKTPIYLFCVFEELFDWIKELGFTEVHPLDLNVPVQIGNIEVIPRRALDADVDSIFHIKAGGLNILNVVDSWIDPETLDKLSMTSPWDLVLWPFQTMRELEVISPTRSLAAKKGIPDEWIPQLKALKPRYLVPSSCQFSMEVWSWYNQAFFPISYRDFTEEVQKILPRTEVVRMDPSKSFVLNKETLKLSKGLAWVIPRGDQNVDYSYDPKLTPPTTAHIATHLAELTEDQKQRVLEYCLRGILTRFQTLEQSDEAYFEKPRIWKLSLYDHVGAPYHFFYHIHQGIIRILPEEANDIAWLTELPEAKLYAALDLGESLTSMYMRINDVTFTPEIEKEIELVQITEDPLIRCLFNGAFGAYQKAQLKMIQSRHL